MADDGFWIPLIGTRLAVWSGLLCEQQAMRNHGQSLRRLAERGGLSPSEALAIAERRRWHCVETQCAIERLVEVRTEGG